MCVYLMSAVGIKMEIEDGASATTKEIVAALIDEADLQLPRQVTVTSEFTCVVIYLLQVPRQVNYLKLTFG